ncbi:hypothetical protein D3OALGA1CA_506 [Olavius algarvensis associated proteobacterium Delta 3]|nr:hypothetical protein D3OALGB2SA_432 [Olavius algarvensis associated proteobacterium Delta 3]CAB5084906.1 hypothetical protein D3OALGA1CA_506 [Olavius algarvensis associated proteobacterium Delta 3]
MGISLPPPIFLVHILLGARIVFTEGTAAASFIYAILG